MNGDATWTTSPVSRVDDVVKAQVPSKLDLKNDEVLKLNVGGIIFQTFVATLSSVPNTRLSRLVEDTSEGLKEHFFDRNATIFEYVLELYRSGELHFPKSMCILRVKKELEFWEIPLSLVSKCCRMNIDTTEDAIEWENKMAAKFAMKEPLCPPPIESSSWIKKAQYNMWLVTLNPQNSLAGAFYGVMYTLFTLTNVVVIILDSNQSFRDINANKTFVDSVKSTISNPKQAMYVYSNTHVAINAIDLTCTAFFTLELFIRFLLYPKKVLFVKSFLNIIDTLCLMMSWCHFALTLVVRGMDPASDLPLRLQPLFLFFGLTAVFRMLRLIAFAYKFLLMRVLILALFESYKVLLLMVVVMSLGVLTFSPAIYLAEFGEETSFRDMTIACWWSIITMTTVGYGDQYPVSFPGMIIGSLCALVGLVLTALPIAVIGGNFNKLYDFYVDNLLTEKRPEDNTKENKVEPYTATKEL